VSDVSRDTDSSADRSQSDTDSRVSFSFHITVRHTLTVTQTETLHTPQSQLHPQSHSLSHWQSRWTVQWGDSVSDWRVTRVDAHLELPLTQSVTQWSASKLLIVTFTSHDNQSLS